MSPLGIMPPQTSTGIKIMSINLMLEDEEQAVIWRGPMITSAINQFWNDVFWGDLDTLVIDMPPGTSDAALTRRLRISPAWSCARRHIWPGTSTRRS